MRTAVVVGLLAMMTLAGCLSEEPVEHGPLKDSHDDADPFNDGGSTLREQPEEVATETEGPAENTPPTALLTADVDNGTAPFNVTFALDGTDLDGDALSWSFDADGDGVEEANGTQLPAAFTFSYVAPGVYNATLNLTDGLDVALANATILANGTAAAGAGFTPHVVTGSTATTGSPVTSGFVLVAGGIGAQGCLGFNLGENGMDCVFGEIPAGYGGAPFLFEATTGAGDYEIWDTCDAVLGLPVQEFGGDPEGNLPAGAGCVIMWEYGTGTGTFTFTLG